MRRICGHINVKYVYSQRIKLIRLPNKSLDPNKNSNYIIENIILNNLLKLIKINKNL